jgi:hypothetical protein
MISSRPDSDKRQRTAETVSDRARIAKRDAFQPRRFTITNAAGCKSLLPFL